LVKDGGWHRGGRKRALALGAALAVAFIVALVANASASTTYTVTPVWLGGAAPPSFLPDTPSSGGLYGDYNLVAAMSSDGAAIAAWANSTGGLNVSSLDPSSGGWSAPSSPSGVDMQAVSYPSEVGGLSVAPTVSDAMDAAGDGVVAWYTGPSQQAVQYMYELAGGGWSTPVTVAVPDSSDVDSVQVVMNSAGDAALAVGYTPSSGLSIELATGNTSGGAFSFGTPAAIPQPSNAKSAVLPQIAIDAAGDVLTTWIETFNSGNSSNFDNAAAYASFESSGSSPSAATPVGSTGMTTDDGAPAVAMNASGQAVIAWPNSVGGNDVVEEADATLSQLETSGGPVFDAPGTVGSSGPVELFPNIALSSDGTTAVAWTDASNQTVDSIIRPAADFGTTNWTSTSDLQSNSSACSSNACSQVTVYVPPQLAFAQGDDVVLLWTGTDYGAYSVMSQGDSYAGLTGASQLETGDTSHTSSDWPYDESSISLTTDGAGDAVGTWVSQDGGGANYQAVADEMDGAGTSFNIPATATPNTPVTFTASNPWTWESPTTTWSGTGGLSGTGDSVSNTYTALGTYTVTATTTDSSGAVDVVNTTIAVQDAQSITFPPPGGGTVGGGTESLSATGGASGNPVVFSVDPTTSPSGACSVSGTNGSTVSFAHAGSCVIDANQAGDTNYSAAPQTSQTITVGKGSQSINFTAPGGGTVGGSESLSATGGGSGEPVVFTVDSTSSPSGACSVSGTNGATVSFAHAGSCVIDANQAGDSDYSAAPQSQQTITVGKASQSIGFPAPGGGTVGGSESLSATGGGSGNAVVFTVDSTSSPSDACSVSGTNGATVSFAHAGSCVIDANQAGNSDYSAAAPASQTIAVGKASQSISGFTAPTGATVGGSGSLSATGGASGNPVVFSVDSSSGAGVCSVSGTNGATVAFAHAGSCVLDVNQAGDSDYSAAPQSQHTISVAKASQSISGFTAPTGATVGGSGSLSATGGASGNPVVFSVDSSSGAGVCSVSGTNGATVAFAHAGSCVIDANQAGDSDYSAAPQSQHTISVAKASQSISGFTAPTGATVGGSGSLSATGGGSGEPVTFTVDSSSSPAGVCSVSGTNGATVAFAHAGSCVIDANQAGDSDYSAAPQAQQTITVGKASQAISGFTAPTPATVGGGGSLSASGGGSGQPVVFLVDGSSGAGVCSVSGTNGATVSFAHTGSCVIDASQAGDADYSGAPQSQQTITVGKAPQSISVFTAPATAAVGGSGSLSATGGGSGEPVMFTVDSSSSPAGVCSVSGTNGATVRFAHAGSCVIDANQAGDADYTAAPQSQQTISVAQMAQSIIFTAPGDATVGGNGSLSATGGASGSPVVFSVDPTSSPADACSVSGTDGRTVSFAHAGSCVIDVNQGGNSDYSAAPQSSRTISVAKASQSISFPAPPAGAVGGSEPLSATGGGSGNPVVFSVDASSSPSGVCSVSGSDGATVTFASAGSCVIDANQAGNSDYSAASPVSRTVAVSAAPTGTTTVTPASTTTPPPVLGQSSDVSKTSGTVQVELPGTHTFVTVSASEQIPFGAVIDATNGKVTATIALPGGGTSTATFWAGEFTLSQSSSGALAAKLVDGSSAGCPTSAKASRQASHLRAAHERGLAKVTKKKPGAVVGSLWTNAKGSYSTSGKNGSAAVLGTEWLTRDQCDGTFFEVTKTSNDPHGEIRVTVRYPHKHTVLLKRGHSLLAPAPGFP
jgi:hypothetical protein